MKNLLYLAILLLCACCAPVYAPLRGDYPEKIVWKETEMSYNESFDTVIEFLTERGIEVQDIDRPNGIIRLSAEIEAKRITLEKNGKASNQKSYVVISQNRAFFQRIKSTIVVLVRPIDQKSKIGIRLIPKAQDPTGANIYADVATLGTFESQLLESITKPK